MRRKLLFLQNCQRIKIDIKIKPRLYGKAKIWSYDITSFIFWLLVQQLYSFRQRHIKIFNLTVVGHVSSKPTFLPSTAKQASLSWPKGGKKNNCVGKKLFWKGSSVFIVTTFTTMLRSQHNTHYNTTSLKLFSQNTLTHTHTHTHSLLI